MYEADDGWDYDGENLWHIGQSNRPIIIYEEVIRDLGQNYPNHRSQDEIERHNVLHEVLHRFVGPHDGTSLTTAGNMNPETTVTQDDAANALTRQQLRYVQYKEYRPEL